MKHIHAYKGAGLKIGALVHHSQISLGSSMPPLCKGSPFTQSGGVISILVGGKSFLKISSGCRGSHQEGEDQDRQDEQLVHAVSVAENVWDG